jgi:hypothetical protein
VSSTYTNQILAAIPTYCPSCPPSLVTSLVNAESSGNMYGSSGAPLTSSAGAIGLFQLEPATAAGLNVDPTSVSGNIQGGLTYLQQLYNQFGNWPDALAAYNEGPGALQTQLNAGVTPTSAGYASGILAAAGISDSSSLPSDSSDSGTSDSSFLDSLTGSIDLSALTDLPDETGLSWPLLALIGVGILGAAYALA